jgi:hypothetical protein
MNIRKYVFSASLLLSALGAIATVSPSAFAQKAVRPQIDSFYVEPSTQLTPGTDLTFTVEGTPRGKASVRVPGISRIIPLKEVESGVYEGDYTISRRDRISPSATMRATLTVRGKSATVSERFSDAPVASAPAAAPVPAPAPQTAALAIQRFTVTPISRIEPGADLKFTVFGTPGAKASFTIDGIASNVPMQEVRSGQYEGSYTIRRLDHFPSNLNIVGTLEANGQVIRSRLTQALVTDARPPVIKNLSPRDGETITGNQVLVSATFDDAGGVGVDPRSVRIMIGGVDVTRSATITPQFFTYRGEMRPGSHQVEVSARDLSGNAVRQAWTFVTAAQAAPVATVLPLQILSHTNNAQVGKGTIEVRGRTAPDAKIDVQVQAIAQIAGFFGLNQNVYNQSLRSDGNGNFVFSFQPQIPVPGTRYEITMNASKADLTKEMRLVLFQQQ